jgi:hypothetical protein
MVRWYLNRKHVKVLRGWFAWEVQVGRIVVQWVHAEHRDGPCAEGRRVLVYRDHYKIAGR